MMLSTLAALAAGLVADGSVRVEARGGTTVGGQDPSSIGVSGDLQGRVSDPDGVLRFGVAPSAVLAQGSQLFVRGFAEGDLRFRNGAWARVRQALGYGSMDLSALAPGPPRDRGRARGVPPLARAAPARVRRLGRHDWIPFAYNWRRSIIDIPTIDA